MAKNRIFSGQTLSDKEIREIQEQLKRSRERDIAAMKKTNELREARGPRKIGRSLTGKYKKEGVSGAKKGSDAEDKWILMKEALGQDAYEDIYEDMGYESGDIIDAADYIADNYVRGEQGMYFNKQDMIDTIKKLKDKAYGSLDPNNVPKL